MSRYSPAVEWALARIGALDLHPTSVGTGHGFERNVGHNVLGHPHLTLIDEPSTPIEEAIEALEQQTSAGRQMARLLTRHDPDTPQIDPNTGRVYLNGRECCYALSLKLNEQLARLPVPSDHRCPDCGSTWRLVHRVAHRPGSL